MELKEVTGKDINLIKDIYIEAFPKLERKPFCSYKKEIINKKARLYVVFEGNNILGFVSVMPFKDLLLVDYLAINKRNRGNGCGTFILKSLQELNKELNLVLMIERINDKAPNIEQRIKRKQFYFKNGFKSSNIFIKLPSGEMEILCTKDNLTKETFLELEKHALGKLYFFLSRFKFVSE